MRFRPALLWEWLKERKRQRQETAPDSFRLAAEEMLELARMARRVWPEDQKFQAQLRRIELEMHQLQEMSSKRRFRSLSQQRLQELKNNLENSRQMIIHSLETVPPPTDRFQ